MATVTMGRPLLPRTTQLGRRLTQLREAREWTQADAAQALGVTHRSWLNWERGKRVPDKFTLRAIATMFNVKSFD